MRRRFVGVAAVVACMLAPAAARAAEVPEGAVWSEATIEVPDGVQLHADILRPKGLPDSARTPVILSIGPYFNHSGQTGPVDGGYDPVGPSPGPSGRFYDLIEGGRLMERGYTWVQVDLRGFGGSSGCLDWMGPGEQADVTAAVEWAAAQPWSTGRVGMYGKSYDGVTGLVGVLAKPKGLAAVVAQEPVYDLYRYLYSNGVRYLNSLATPALYDLIAATPGPLRDDPLYNVGGATDPACLAINFASQQDPDHGSAYWRARDLIAPSKGSKVPLFLTQGFLENNTKPDGAFEYFNTVAGPKRAWFGMWDHVRGNDVDDEGRLLMGRAGFFEEVMRFFDHYVREVPLADAPVDRDPPVVVQTSDGSWRAEAAWPPADSRMLRSALRPGSYVDDADNNGTGSGAGAGVWTVSPPLAHDAWYSGVARAEVDLAVTAPNANVVVNVYDIAADGRAILLAREASLVPSGGGKVALELYGNDWKIPAGHRLGVLVSGSNAEWWTHLPTHQTVTVNGGFVDLPFLSFTRTATLPGSPAVRLENWLESAPFEVAADVLASAVEPGFALPGALRSAALPAVTPAGPGSARRLMVRIARRGRRALTVYGNAPARARLSIRLLRGRRVVARRHLRTRVNAFRMSFRTRGAGRYRAVVSMRRAGRTLRATSRALRVR